MFKNQIILKNKKMKLVNKLRFKINKLLRIMYHNKYQ
jgi:hypothetical protein